VATDVTKEGELVQSLRAAREECGALDIVVNNAGIENRGSFIEASDGAEFARIIEINQIAAYNVLHHAPGFMNDGSSIIADRQIKPGTGPLGPTCQNA
jgi:NAD(P)-dependent dehydrogenase (short-subunit alcohol dehydrogenase family)